jgi:hypothetical protein
MLRGSKYIVSFILFLFLFGNSLFSAPISEQVIVDQFGWRTTSKKVAILAKPITGQNNGVTFTLPAAGASFEVRRASDNSTAYSGTVTRFNAGATNIQSGDQVCWADFTALTTPGTYYIYDPTNNVQSYNFDIRDDIFNNILKTAGRFFFYQRCGGNIDAVHGGNWNHTACHEGANQDLAAHLWNGSDQGQAKDVHGGWHDAGDFNKYVPFTLEAVFALLMAYELNPSAFGDDWNIPESGNGVPDVLDEIKWELDWMLRMQKADGSVCNRVGVLNYVTAYPQNDSQNRYYTAPTTWATSTLAGLCAHAARLFGAYSAQYPGYVNTLTTAAQNAWTYLAANTTMTPASGADGGGSGGGSVFAAASGNGTADDDARRRLFAAAELYKTTGNAIYRTYFDANYNSSALTDNGHNPISSGYFDTSSSWTSEMGMIVYASISGYATNAAAVSAIKASLKAGIENNVVGSYSSNTDPYRAYMWDGHYCWGSNQIKAQWGELPIFGIYLNVNPANNALYKECSEEYLHYFHGRNPLSYIYLSNMGAKGANLTSGKSPMQIYHGWFYAGSPLYDGASSTYGQAPGMLAGGPNQYYDVSTIIPPASQPPQKSFKDWNIGWNGSLDEHSWEVTEPGIYYQAKYDMVLAYFAGSAGTPTFTPTLTPYAGSPTFTSTVTPTYSVTQTNTPVTVTILNTCDSMGYNGTWSGSKATRSINSNAAYISQGTGSLIVDINQTTNTASWNDGIAMCSGIAPVNWSIYGSMTMDVYIDPVVNTPWLTGSAYHELCLYVDSAAAPGGGKFYRQIAANQPITTGWNHLTFTINCALDTASHLTDPNPAAILSTDPISDYFFVFNSDTAKLSTGTMYFDNLVLNALPPTPTSTVTAAAGTFTFTRTATFTPTYTRTGSPTYSYTATYTRTATASYTPSPSPTVQVTFTSTPTVTETACSCPSWFGNGAVGAIGPIADTGYMDSNTFNMAEDGVAHSLSIYISSTSGGNIRLALYTNSGWTPHEPVSLIVQSAEQASIVGWNTIPIPDTLLTAGTYWISWQVSPGVNLFRSDGPADCDAYVAQSYGVFQGNPTGFTLDTTLFSVKANYCPVTCGSPTFTCTGTPSCTRTFTPTRTPTSTVTQTFTQTPTETTYAGSPTETFTDSATPTISPTPTVTDVVCACPAWFGRDGTFVSTIDDWGYIDSNKFILTEDANVRSLSIRVASTTGGPASMAIYDDASGQPGNLIVQTAQQATVADWNTFAIPVTLLSAGTYWISFQVTNSTVLYADYGSTGDDYYVTSPLVVFPSVFPAGTQDVLIYDVKADYCPVICVSPTSTPTVSVTPTYVGTCACPNIFGKSYTSASSLNPVNFITANWYGISEDGNAQSISINVASGTGQCSVALYSNTTGGTPGAPQYLISQSDAVTVVPGWNRIDIPQVGLAGGNVYWIAFQVDANVNLSYETGATGDMYYLAQPMGDFPGVFNSSNNFTDSFDVQVHYCPVSCPKSPTPTATNSATVTFTPTMTATPTNPPPGSTSTFTPTYTATPSATYTVSPTITLTNTPQSSATSTVTATAAMTMTFTATPSITPVATSSTLTITNMRPYPDPYNPDSGKPLSIGFDLSRNCSSIEFKLYTTSARLVRRYSLDTMTTAGSKDLVVDKSNFSGLSNGTYFYVLKAVDTANSMVYSKIDKFIILK